MNQFDEGICRNCPLPNCDETHVQCLYRIWRKGSQAQERSRYKNANVERVAKWYVENKERRHAYLRERYKRMKGGEVRSYGQSSQKLTASEVLGTAT